MKYPCIAFIAFILINTHLFGMDPIPSVFLIKSILDSHIRPQVSLQEMSRFMRTCKSYNGMVDTESFLNENSYPLDHLFNQCPYDARTIVLAHYGLTKNNEMFSFLWNKEKELRNDDVMYFHSLAASSLEYSIYFYAKEYSTRKKIQQVRIKQLQVAAPLGNNNRFSLFLKKILPGSGFNIWDAEIVFPKKLLSSLKAKQKTKKCRKKIVKALCASQDADLLLAIMGDIIEPRAFKYIFMWSERLFIEVLREKSAFIENVPDKHNKTFSDYKKQYMPKTFSGYQRLYRPEPPSPVVR